MTAPKKTPNQYPEITPKLNDKFDFLNKKTPEKIKSLIWELYKLNWVELSKWNKNKEKNIILQKILVELWYDIIYYSRKLRKWVVWIDWDYGNKVKTRIKDLQLDLWLSNKNWIFDSNTFDALKIMLDKKLEAIEVKNHARIPLENFVEQKEQLTENIIVQLQGTIQETRDELPWLVNGWTNYETWLTSNAWGEIWEITTDRTGFFDPVKQWELNRGRDYDKFSNDFDNVRYALLSPELTQWLFEFDEKKDNYIQNLESLFPNRRAHYYTEYFTDEFRQIEINIIMINILKLIEDWLDNVDAFKIRDEKLEKLENKFNKLYEYRTEFMEEQKKIYEDFEEKKATMTSEHDPREILYEKYKDSPEQEKIELLMAIWTIMVKELYDYSKVNMSGDVNSEEIWDKAKKWIPSVVCRHIHSEMAIMAKRLWIKAWVVSTQKSISHAIMWWQKSDWTYIMIDYWTLYVWKNPKQLMTNYLIKKWAISLKEIVTDAEWNPIWFLQPEMERIFEEAVSSILIWDSLDYSGNLAKKWIAKITKWHKIYIKDENKRLDTSLTFWNWTNFEWWVFSNNVNAVPGFDFRSSWVSWRYQLWDNNTWTISIWWKIANNQLLFPNIDELWEDEELIWWITRPEKQRNVNTFWFDIQLAKNVYKTEGLDINIAWTWQSILLQDPRNLEEKGRLAESQSTDIWSSISWTYKPTNNLTLTWWAWYWFDVSTSNIRLVSADENLLSIVWLYWKRSIEWWASYKLDNWTIMSWDISRKDSLWTTETWLNLWVKKWDFSVTWWLTNTDNSANPFLLDESKQRVWIEAWWASISVINNVVWDWIWQNIEVWYSWEVFDWLEVKVPIISEKLINFYKAMWLKPDKVEVPKSEILTTIQIFGLLNWDKISKETKLKLWIMASWWWVLFPEQVKEQLLIWYDKNKEPKEVKKYVTSRLITIWWRLNTLFDEKWSTSLISSNLSTEYLFEEWSVLDSMKLLVSTNATLSYMKATFAKDFENKTLWAWVYWALSLEWWEVWIAIEWTEWNDDGTWTWYWVDINLLNLLWSKWVYSKKTKHFEWTEIWYRFWFSWAASFLSNILNLQPIVSKNPWKQVTDIMTWEMFMKYGRFFQTLTKDKEDLKLVWSIILSLLELEKDWRWIFMDDILEQMKDPRNLLRLDWWLKENVYIIKSKPKWNVIFWDFEEWWKNKYDKAGNNIEVYWDESLFQMKEYNDILKGYNEQDYVNYSMSFLILYPKIQKILKSNHIELELYWEITLEQINWLALFIERLWKQTNWLEKIKYRKIRIIDEKIFQRDVSISGKKWTLIEIEKNVLEELNARWKKWKIEKIENNSWIKVEWLEQYKSEIIALANANSLDIKWIEIVWNRDSNLKYTRRTWWWRWRWRVRTLYKEIKSTDDWKLLMSESFLKNLINWLENKKEENREEELYIDYLKEVNLSSLSNFDVYLERKLRTQEQRLAKTSREMWRSRFLDYRPRTEIYIQDKNVKTEYDVYDVMNRPKYSISITLKENYNINVEVNEKWTRTIFDIASLVNEGKLEVIKNKYPWVLKILVWLTWVRPAGKKDTLSWIIPLMIQFRNEAKKMMKNKK